MIYGENYYLKHDSLIELNYCIEEADNILSVYDFISEAGTGLATSEQIKDSKSFIEKVKEAIKNLFTKVINFIKQTFEKVARFIQNSYIQFQDKIRSFYSKITYDKMVEAHNKGWEGLPANVYFVGNDLDPTNEKLLKSENYIDGTHPCNYKPQEIMTASDYSKAKQIYAYMQRWIEEENEITKSIALIKFVEHFNTENLDHVGKPIDAQDNKKWFPSPGYKPYVDKTIKYATNGARISSDTIQAWKDWKNILNKKIDEFKLNNDLFLHGEANVTSTMYARICLASMTMYSKRISKLIPLYAWLIKGQYHTALAFARITYAALKKYKVL